jgi:cell division protein FtsB
MLRITVVRWGLSALLLVSVSALAGDSVNGNADASQKEIEKLQQRLADETAQNAKLREQNTKLSRELTDMGERLNQLEKQLKAPRDLVLPQLKWAPLPEGATIAPNPRRIPDGWQEQQFNGVPYYIIPLQNSAEHATRTARNMRPS